MLDRPRKSDTSVTVSFALNGREVDVAAEPFVSLAVTLRETLGLTGTKIGCDAGDCGACTVLLDGQQVCACLVATAQAEGASIQTVEGHARDGLTDRLREAFLKHGAAQCGICTPGMLMAATDCLMHDPRADRATIADALAGVLCRCTGYVKIIEAVMDVAGSSASAGGEAKGALSVVGARLPRVDGRAKVDGTDIFGADYAPPGCLWMRIVRSPHASATFTLGDLDAVIARTPGLVGSSRVDLQACKLEYSIVSPK